MVFNLLIGQHLFSHPQLCRCVRNDATFPMFSCDWEFWGSCASVSWLLRKGRGLLGKAEMVQQVHLTPQSYWMIYSVNGFNYGRAHTHTHTLNGLMDSFPPQFRFKATQSYWAKPMICTTAALSHTHRTNRSTVGYVLSLHGLSSHPQAHMHTCKHTFTWACAHTQLKDCRTHSNTQTDKLSHCLNWTD